MTTIQRAVPADGGASSPDGSDLGFGALVARETKKRLLNRDGTFNVRREGLSFWDSLSLYHFLLGVSWPRFVALVVAAFLLLNTGFALVYVACGPGALEGGAMARDSFAQAFFFSVETLATIGYGNIAPASLPAHVVVTLESLVGLLAFSVAAGLAFARFSRPTAAIIFSDRAVVAPHRTSTAFMFRIVNGRSNQLLEMSAQVTLTRRGPDGPGREFHQLELERRRVAFFPLSWTIVHAIDQASPLYGVTAQALRASEAEFLILLRGTDETFAQAVYARSSYKAEEVTFGARFKNIFKPPSDEGDVSIDVGRLSEVEPATS